MNQAVQPTRLLFDKNKETQHKYTPASHTATDGILARWRYERSEHNPANYPDDSHCNEVDAAGTFKG